MPTADSPAPPEAPMGQLSRTRKREGAPLLEARQLSAGYGGVPIIQDIDLRVCPGEVVCLLGPNGAGKSTTILTLAGELKPLAGEVLWYGEPTRAPLHARARKGIGLVTEERSVFMSMSVADNLRVGCRDPEVALELFPELRDRLNVQAGLLSGGEQQMLSLSRALARQPSLLLADELSLGLAPLAVDRLHSAVRRAATANGVAVLLVEQHVSKALEIADHVYLLRRGRMIAAGPADEFQDRTRIEEAYL